MSLCDFYWTSPLFVALDSTVQRLPVTVTVALAECDFADLVKVADNGTQVMYAPISDLDTVLPFKDKGVMFADDPRAAYLVGC